MRATAAASAVGSRSLTIRRDSTGTSGAAQAPRAYWGPYAASKAGLEALVKVYANEVEKIHAELYQKALDVADPGMDKGDLFREAMKVFVRVQAGKRLAALGGSFEDAGGWPSG